MNTAHCKNAKKTAKVKNATLPPKGEDYSEAQSESIVNNESESIVNNESVFDYPDEEEQNTEIEPEIEYNEDESKEGEPEEEEDDFADILRDTVSGESVTSDKEDDFLSIPNMRYRDFVAFYGNMGQARDKWSEYKES